MAELLEGLLDSNLPKVTSTSPLLPTPPPTTRQNRLSEAREEPPADQTQSVRVDPETLSGDATLQLQPFIAALRWHGHMKPVPPKSESSEDPVLSPLTALPEILISQGTERQLWVHFHHISACILTDHSIATTQSLSLLHRRQTANLRTLRG